MPRRCAWLEFGGLSLEQSQGFADGVFVNQAIRDILIKDA